VLETFTRETFTPLLGEAFRLHVEGSAAVDVVLTDAAELPMASARPGRAPFSLVFSGPPATVYPQATYRLEHPGLGVFELFLVPIGADGEGVRYEAVFT
jgi:hypothetical protein